MAEMFKGLKGVLNAAANLATILSQPRAARLTAYNAFATAVVYLAFFRGPLNNDYAWVELVTIVGLLVVVILCLVLIALFETEGRRR